MKYFQQIARDIDVSAIMHQLHRQPNLWNENTLRTQHPGTAHSEVDDIWVFFNDPDGDVANDKEVIPYCAWKDIPALRPILFGLMNQVQAVRVGRVIITRLPPGKQIYPHKDGGAPAHYYERYQLALQCLPGNVFYIGDEQVSFRTGDMWHIDNKAEHSVVNNSGDDRIVCIIDLRCE